LWGQLAKTATRPAADEPEPPKRKEKEKTDKGLFRQMAAALINAATIAKAANDRHWLADLILEPEAYEQTAALNTLDSMNPYWEPDAHLTGIDGDNYNSPTQDYYPLQL
jgi:hypothetical protein